MSGNAFPSCRVGSGVLRGRLTETFPCPQGSARLRETIDESASGHDMKGKRDDGSKDREDGASDDPVFGMSEQLPEFLSSSLAPVALGPA